MESGTDPLLQWLSSAGSLGILAAACVAFLRGWIVPGSAHARVIGERNRALDLVYATIEKSNNEIKILEGMLIDERKRVRELERREEKRGS